MIFLFHGSDVNKVRTKAFEWITAARNKEPNLVYIHLSHTEITDAALEEVSLSGGLFVKRLLVLIDDPFSATRVKDVSTEAVNESLAGSLIEKYLDTFVASDNAIIILAPKLTATKVKKIATKATKEYVFNTSATNSVTRSFNSNLVNALATRSRETLWLEIIRALRLGETPEMLHGLLHWKARDLMSKRNRAWKPSEARRLSLDLITLVQDSRRKGRALSLELEHWALTI